MTDDRFGPGYGPLTLAHLDPRLEGEWEAVRRFIPIEGVGDPVVIASLGFTDHRGFVATGHLPDGREWGVSCLPFGHAQLGVWRPDLTDRGSHDDTWDFHNVVIAVLAAGEWALDLDVEPRWWLRHPASSRYRHYNDDGSWVEGVKLA
jgi:hypothetical protein